MLCHCVGFLPPSENSIYWTALEPESWKLDDFLVANNRLVKMVHSTEIKTFKTSQKSRSKVFDSGKSLIYSLKPPNWTWKKAETQLERLVFQPSIFRTKILVLGCWVQPGKWRLWRNMEVRFRWFSRSIFFLWSILVEFHGRKKSNRPKRKWRRLYNQSLGLDFSPLNWKYDNLFRFRCPTMSHTCVAPDTKKICIFDYERTQ